MNRLRKGARGCEQEGWGKGGGVRGCEQEGWGKGGGVRGWGKGVKGGGIYI